MSERGRAAPQTPLSGTLSAVMTAPVITVEAGVSMAAAAQTMAKHRIGAVVVTRGDNVEGILTERDVLRAVGDGVNPEAAGVVDWMTPSPDMLPAEADLEQAWRQMAAGGYRHLPIIDGCTLVGIVSLRDLAALAAVRPADEGRADAPPGLDGVVVATTTIGDVRGREGFYHYRQYSATELASHRTFEDVWHLLFRGELPDADQAKRFRGEISAARQLPPRVLPALEQIISAGSGGGALDGVRSAVSVTAATLGLRPVLDLELPEVEIDAVRLCALMPILVAALHRLRAGQEPIAPRRDLDHVANYLYCLNGAEPDEAAARAVEQYMITTIDHGFNASTFTARVVTSTGADVGAAVTAAIGALSGPLHGGAPSRALEMLDEVRSPEAAAAWVRKRVADGQRVMGFGHRVYKTEDPRSRLLKEIATQLGGPRVESARQVEETVVSVLGELKPGRALYANVEYYAGVVMERCGLPAELFTPTFAVSRAVGWCAHILEQAADNRIIRPSARYVGPSPPQALPTQDHSTSETKQ